jgi:hypothetical protein
LAIYISCAASRATQEHSLIYGYILSRCHGSDQHTALLSIKSGQGSQTHDRVYTFKPEFKTQDCALMYAAAQGRNWLVNPASLA